MRVLALTLACAGIAIPQTTQVWLTGRVTDSLTGNPIADATVRSIRIETAAAQTVTVGSGGSYTFPDLSPGAYTLIIEADNYQAREYHSLELPVAGQVTLDFELRPLGDVWEARRPESLILPNSTQILAFYGPDLDLSRRVSVEPDRKLEGNLDSSVSTVIRRTDLRELPLTSRDAYSLLVLLAGVTSDTSVGRGLGFSVNGQRPSSASFLLDGMDNNYLLVTGPLEALAPEFLGEYRISTNNFSAEYGRTAGFLANAISRSGTNDWHGDGFAQFKNEWLNANGFQENAHGIRRTPLKEARLGALVEGPLWRNRIFWSGALQGLRFRSTANPRTFALPTPSFVASTDAATDAGSLLRRYRPALAPEGPGDSGLVSIAPPIAIDHAQGLTRLDWADRVGANRIFARGLLTRSRQPELVFNPYLGFSSPLHLGAVSIVVGWTWQISPALTQELRAGRSGDSNRYDRPHSEIPQFTIFDRIAGNRVLAPSSESSFAFRNITRNWEGVGAWTYLAGRHRWKFGAGFLRRFIETDLMADRDGAYSFFTLEDFRKQSPVQLLAAYDRTLGNEFRAPPTRRMYESSQAHFFAQDAFQWTPRLSLSYGIRLDYQASPVNTGENKDLLLKLGQGRSFAERLASTTFAPISAGDQTAYDSQGAGWGPRFGFSYDLWGTGTTLLRGSYGIFYDRPFDNLWQPVSVNRQSAGVWQFSGPVALLAPRLPVGPAGSFVPSSQYHQPLLFQPGLRNPKVQSAFIGVQHRIGAVSIEQNLLASRGRGLWTTDLVNRLDSVPGSPQGRYIPSSELEDLYYRANQGSSEYYASTTTLRFRRAQWSGQVSYTWSHTIDNQSNPLVGIFEDYNKRGEATADDPDQQAAFARQFDSHADRGNSDFDQRHNLVFFGMYETATRRPRFRKMLSGWRISGLGSLRAGLPFSVLASSFSNPESGGSIFNQRADLIGDATLEEPVPGGQRLLRRAAFRPAGAASVGGTGRNAFVGPGFVSADLSLARRFPVPGLREGSALTLRIDAFNAFNHANLTDPDRRWGSENFGVALYGRREKTNGFPALVPLAETARQIQVLIHLQF